MSQSRLLSSGACFASGAHRMPLAQPLLRRTSVREANEKKMAPKPVKNVVAPAAALWFRHNENLGPPYYIILDTNAINFA